jgi:tRNA1(Val) A37 N6-methylase TrmN6
MSDVAEGITEDTLLGGRVRLLQPARGHRAGTDAVLLAAAAPVRPGNLVIDVGAASGAVGLMIAARVAAALVFVERDPALAGLCRRNAGLNGTDGRIVVADVLDPTLTASGRSHGSADGLDPTLTASGRSHRSADGLDPTLMASGLFHGSADGLDRASSTSALAREIADVVVTNPPFLEEGETRISPDSARAAAHVLPPGGLERWLRACSELLKPRGALALIHRADRLGECLGPLSRGFGGQRLRFVHPRADRPATRVLITAVKGSRAPLVVAPPVILHDEAGRFTPEAEALHRGDRTLS